MNGALGHTGVLLALASSLVGAAVLAVGLARHNEGLLRSARVYAWLVLAGAVVATIAMQRALLTHDFSLAFVAANNSRQTPILYSITGMWSALAGSILLWGLILAGYLAAMVWRFRHRATDPLVAWATLTVLLVVAFFFGLMAGPSDPFSHVVGPVPTNGPGPNVLLQNNPLVLFHPPLLYLGFVGFTIPFAFAVASLVTGRIGEGWQLATRRWTLFAWACLTIGIMLGAWWSYQVLGWGGFWAWDPVENASLLPWLTATAFLHSVLVQERRGLLRVWNLSLVIATFSLTILGTFLTRSGVIESVHAFSGSNIGPVLISFLAVVLIGGIGLIAWRGDRLRSPGGIDSPLSREGAFLVNNLLFVGFAFVVLLGTVFPLAYQAFTNQQVTVGAPYFDAMTLPIGLALLVLMAIGPALPWRKTTVSTLGDRLLVPAWGGALVLVVCVAAGLRGLVPLVAFTLGGFAASANIRQLALAARSAHRHGVGWWRGLTGRANGGMIVHVGVVIVAVAFTSAMSFGHRGQVRLLPGQSATFDGHRIALQRIQTVRTPVKTATEAVLRVDGTGHFAPAVSQYGTGTNPVGTPAVDSGLVDDVYLTVDSLPTTATGALDPHGAVTVGVAVQPLVLWLWVGGVVLVAGSILAAVPSRRRRAATEPASAPVPAVAARQAALAAAAGAGAGVPAGTGAGRTGAGRTGAGGTGAGDRRPEEGDPDDQPVTVVAP